MIKPLICQLHFAISCQRFGRHLPHRAVPTYSRGWCAGRQQRGSGCFKRFKYWRD